MIAKNFDNVINLGISDRILRQANDSRTRTECDDLREGVDNESDTAEQVGKCTALLLVLECWCLKYDDHDRCKR